MSVLSYIKPKLIIIISTSKFVNEVNGIFVQENNTTPRRLWRVSDSQNSDLQILKAKIPWSMEGAITLDHPISESLWIDFRKNKEFSV